MATQSSINLAQQMFVAYYGRPGDPGGLAFWADKFDATNDLTSALTQFGNSLEFTESFDALSASDLISNLYQQMYGHAPDPGGLEFYLGRLDTGAATLASIAKQIADGSQDSDLDTLNNRITVANTFTTQVESTGATYSLSDIPGAQALLATVDGTAESVTAANTSATTFVNELPDAVPDVPASTESLVGSWNLSNASDSDDLIAFKFNADGTYSMWETGGSSVTEGPQLSTDSDNPSGYQGSETGTYSWDESTGQLSVLSITSDSNGDWGLSDFVGGAIQVDVTGDESSYPEDGLLFDRNTDSSFVGSWQLTGANDPDDDITFTFNSDGTYVHWETGGSSVTDGPTLESDSDNPSGYQGQETGTYEWDESTGTLTVLTITSDANGDWGLSDAAGGGTVHIDIIGSVLIAPDDGLVFA